MCCLAFCETAGITCAVAVGYMCAAMIGIECCTHMNCMNCNCCISDDAVRECVEEARKKQSVLETKPSNLVMIRNPDDSLTLGTPNKN